jgi:flagellar hook-basal body complex protein FliE
MGAIGPISNIGNFSNLSKVSGPQSTNGASAADGASGFGGAVMKGLDSVAGMEKKADNLVANMAAGQNVQISDVMAATSKANLGMAIVNELRTRGLEAYQSIINIQV